MKIKPSDIEQYLDILDRANSLQIFSLKRAELLAILKELPPEQWVRKGTIDGRNHTVFGQVRRMALHEAGHYEQVAMALE